MACLEVVVWSQSLVNIQALLAVLSWESYLTSLSLRSLPGDNANLTGLLRGSDE